MSDLTKRAIRQSFVKLLNEKPLKQIAVRDIVDDCGINRNTFYYHFQDIPQLLESIITEDADRIIHKYSRFDSVEDCLYAVMEFSLENRKAVLHIYRSVNRDIFEQYQWRICGYAVDTYLKSVMEGRQIAPEDEKIISAYMKCVLFGTVMGWLEGGMQENVEAFIHRLCELKAGDLETLLERCRGK